MTTLDRGFKLLDAKRRAEIAASGGAAVPPDKRSFSRDRELAKLAGSKGGRASRRPKKPPVAEEATP